MILSAEMSQQRQKEESPPSWVEKTTIMGGKNHHGLEQLAPTRN
jgi:hypothetical protein